MYFNNSQLVVQLCKNTLFSQDHDPFNTFKTPSQFQHLFLHRTKQLSSLSSKPIRISGNVILHLTVFA